MNHAPHNCKYILIYLFGFRRIVKQNFKFNNLFMCINRNNQRYIALTAKLDAMSPLKVLTRGYAMAETADGEVVRSVKQVKTGDSINVSFSDGSLRATVTDVKENGK